MENNNNQTNPNNGEYHYSYINSGDETSAQLPNDDYNSAEHTAELQNDPARDIEKPNSYQVSESSENQSPDSSGSQTYNYASYPYGSQYNASEAPVISLDSNGTSYNNPSQTYAPQYQQQPASPQYIPADMRASDTQTAVSTKNNKKLLIIIIAVLAAALISTIIYAIASHTRNGDKQQSGIVEDEGGVVLNTEDSPVTDTTIDEHSAEPLTYAQIAAKVRRAVVGITVYANYYGWGSYTYSEGSGVIISTDGYVVTNSHVIDDDNYSKYNITVSVVNEDGSQNETTEYEATVIGYDTRTDLAVLKINDPPEGLVVADLGNSNSLVLGDEVVAIGNPGGSQFAGSISNGIVSGLNRVIDETDGTSDSAMRYIQTNAAINPGNSGGPLLNMYGQVVGINTAKIVAEGYEGLGFAIPMDTAKPIIEELIETGSIARPSLGINCSEISSQTSQWYDVPMGLMIKSIDSNSKLNDTEAAVSDIITKCDGVEVQTLEQLQTEIEKKRVGDTVTLTLFRRGQSETFDVTVELIASNSQTPAQEQTPPSNGYNNYGGSYDDFYEDFYEDFFNDFFGNYGGYQWP